MDEKKIITRFIITKYIKFWNIWWLPVHKTVMLKSQVHAFNIFKEMIGKQR